MSDEFSLIKKYFTQTPHQSGAVNLGVGDDAALFTIADHHQCVITTDALISGRHFFPDTNPYRLGQKSLAVNLSDLAAMGAQPIAFTLTLALPQADESWLSAYSQGLLDTAAEFNCDLIGGDTTGSDLLMISITAIGQVPRGQAIRRNTAQVDDDIWVTGTLGDASLALSLLKKHINDEHLRIIRSRLESPTPRISTGMQLRHIAHAMLDLSDGLAGDLKHILQASKVNACIDLDTLPTSPTLRQYPTLTQWQHAISGGDDYELCFTAPISHRSSINALQNHTGVHCTRIGTITAPTSTQSHIISWHSRKYPEQAVKTQDWSGYTHF
ncbi:thiamine-monophosphate kinase [Formosimonas limnophila]|uniref:Thiamine-monophosphate kinase n=1 Tax=Formosimonas limnophila TaxID=1384487 RepID=A0A8J3G0F6_9BURK|nr:thiamine-phosphate kinase [Formosimonas limnophila]GHA78759.1 thiamine-monophosphate kinase [Formosimonas limnophila]